MPKYDVSAYIAACDIHGISAESDLAKALREIISHDTNKLLAAASSYIDIVKRAAAVKAKQSPVKDVAKERSTTEKKVDVAKERSITEKKVSEDDSSCGTPEKSDKPKREVNRFTDAEWEFAKQLYPEEWGVTEVPRSASRFATSLKNKAHIKCAQSLKFLDSGELQKCLKEVFPEKEYSENDNVQIGYAVFAWIRVRQPQHKEKGKAAYE